MEAGQDANIVLNGENIFITRGKVEGELKICNNNKQGKIDLVDTEVKKGGQCVIINGGKEADDYIKKLEAEIFNDL